jgi:hypothetical protein
MSEIRSNVLPVRFSDAELALLRSASKRAIRPVAQFLRWAALQEAERLHRPTTGQEAGQ